MIIGRTMTLTVEHGAINAAEVDVPETFEDDNW